MIAIETPDIPGTKAAAFGPRPAGAATIDWLWTVWIAVLPLGHVTGLHNTLAVLVIGLTLASTRARGLSRAPALLWLVLMLAFAALSLSWSPLPALSGGKFRTDLLLPVLGYLCAYVWALHGGARPMFYGFAAGLLLLAVFSALQLAPADMLAHWSFVDAPNNLGERFVHWYPGVGDASGDVIMALAPLLVWRHLDGQWRDATSSFLALAAVLIILVSKNRDAVLLFPFALAVFAALWNFARPGTREGPSRPAFRLTVASIAIILVLGLLLVIEQVSQRRLLEATHHAVPFGQATLTLIEVDPRPRMWAEYLHLGLQHPWRGIGFGRTLPAQVYDVTHDHAMIADDANRFEHAHNYFLNTWLQQGLIGLLLLLAALVALTRSAIKGLKATPAQALAAVGALTFLLSLLLRNSLDDFLVYSTASAFWIVLGLLLALSSPRPIGDRLVKPGRSAGSPPAGAARPARL